MWVGPDGAAYFTNSNAPQIFGVTASSNSGGYEVELWADATDSIETVPGSNLGGIITRPDRSALVVAQGSTGMLWRFDLSDSSPHARATPPAC